MKFELDLPDAQIDQLREVIDALPLNRYIGLVARMLPQMPLATPPTGEALDVVLRKAVVEYDPKPIATHRWDWVASLPNSDEHAPMGFGDSPEAALADLRTELESR